MFQQFNTDTLMGRVIKNILATTPVPIFNSIDNGDIIIKNCFYLYKHYMIKALSTGTFYSNDEPHYYPGFIHGSPESEAVLLTQWIASVNSETGAVTYTLNDEFVNSKQVWVRTDEQDDFATDASYQIVNHNCTATEDRKYMSTYHSKTNYYDTETHYHLGNYLRYYKASTGIDLMPYYNCYAGQTLENVVLSSQDTVYNIDASGRLTGSALGVNYGSPSYMIKSDITKKCYAVPIKFGKTYTIAIDSNKPVIIRPIVYKDGRMVRASNSLVYSDYPEMEAATVTYDKTEFRKPIRYSVCTHRYDLKQRERYLLLVIQVDSTVDSSLAVLEGDYSHTISNSIVSYTDAGTFDRSDVYTDINHVIKKSPQALSLLQLNTRETYAFADRLIEYLLNNVIDSATTQENNIKRIQDIIRSYDTDYNVGLVTGRYHYGVWDNRLPQVCLELLQPHSNCSVYWDQDGNINKDLEALLTRGWL